MTKILLGEVLQLDLNKEVIDSSKVYEMAGVLSFGKGLFKRDKIENGSTSYKYFLRLSAEHIVMSQLFGWEGALALSSPDFEGCYVSPQFPTFLCDESRLNRKFLGWLMRQPSFWADLGSRAKGMGDRRRTLNPEALFACKIPLPPLAEQQAIVTHLDAMADKVCQVNKHLDAIETDAAAMLRSYIFHPLDKQVTKRHMSELMKLRQPDVTVDRLQQYQFAGVYSFGRGVFPSVMKAGSEFAYERLSTIRAEDFTYPKLMAWEGALGVVPPECDGMVVSPEFPVFSIDTKTVLPEILDIYFRTPHVWPALAEISGGTNMRRRRLQPSAFLNYEMPVPPMPTQRKIVELYRRTQQLKAKHAAIREANSALIPAMLERLFKEQPTPDVHKVIAPSVRTKSGQFLAKGDFYRRTAVDAYIVHALADDPHLGRTKLEKISHLIEYHCRFNLNRQPVRDAYGPNDYPSRRKVEGLAGKQNWFACVDASNRAGVTYVPGEKIADALPVAVDALTDRKPAVDALIELLRPLDTKQCEIIATLYAAWNDLLLRGEHPSDKTLLLEATERWHPNKLSIPASRWHKGIEWLRANEIIPIGQGRPVPEKKETSQ